jgi:hypothetical protein
MRAWQKIETMPEGIEGNIGLWTIHKGQRLWVQSLGRWRSRDGKRDWRGDAYNFVRAFGEPVYWAPIPPIPPYES